MRLQSRRSLLLPAPAGARPAAFPRTGVALALQRSWYAFLIIGVPLIFIAGSAIRGNLLTEPFPFTSFPALLVALVLAAIKGPIEEFGWRGLALPLLQRKFAPIWAGLILGSIWGLWHLPAFLLSGTQQSEWSFMAFLCWMLGDQRHRNRTVQQVAWQHSAVGVLPLHAHESDLSGRATL
jgi:membrane protease YdiL (CAAX protease family)